MENLHLFVEVVNLTNTPLRYYQGDTSRPIQQEYYSWWSHVGLKFDLYWILTLSKPMTFTEITLPL